MALRKKAPAKKKVRMSKGGSTVNKAGNYTKPAMRKRIFNRIKAGSKGGGPLIRKLVVDTQVNATS